MNDSAKMCQIVDVAGEDERRQRERRERLHVLRAGEQAPAIVAIGDDAADQHEEQDRQLREEVVEPEIEIRLRQIEDEPALRVVLHPRADRGAERGEPDEPEVAMRERAGHALRPRSRRLGFGGDGGGSCR